MRDKMRCVGYVKAMEELPRIPTIEIPTQIEHIRKLSETLGHELYKIYIEDSHDSVTEYRRLIEDMVHREFDALMVDNIYCFGRTIFSAADLIENVMLPLGFRVFVVTDGMSSNSKNFVEYLTHSRGYMRASLASLSQKRNKEAGIRSRRAKKQPAFVPEHSLSWYEERQAWLFHEMLRFPDNFHELEDEMRSCRKAIKKLKV